jgi:hypothetical protein
VKQHLPIILVNHLTTEKDVQKTLTAGFVEVDKALAGSRIDCEFSGTTAVVSYLKVGGLCVCVNWEGVGNEEFNSSSSCCYFVIAPVGCM